MHQFNEQDIIHDCLTDIQMLATMYHNCCLEVSEFSVKQELLRFHSEEVYLAAELTNLINQLGYQNHTLNPLYDNHNL